MLSGNTFNRICICFSVLMTASHCCVHAQGKDTIILRRGQIFIGEVKKAQLGEITIDDDDMKFLGVKLYKIRLLTTSRPFRIETNDKEIFIGVIKSSTKDGWVNIILGNGDTVACQITNLSMLIPLEKKFLTRLNGNLSAGFSYTKSSDIGQVNLGSTIQYATRLFSYHLSLSMYGSLDSNEYSRDKEDGSLLTSYSLTPAWFLYGSFAYDRNLELSIARRYQESFGGGNKLFLRRQWQLLALSGIAFNEEKSTSGKASGLLVEIPVALVFDFFKYQPHKMEISSTNYAFFSLSQKGRARIAADTRLSWELISNFYLDFSPYLNFDNQPPEGTSNFDYGVVFSLSFKF
jgi:Protein of unknown function, DUF481